MNIKRIAAGLGTVALIAAGAVIGFAAPASAHTASLTGSAECGDDGSATITWSLTNDWDLFATITDSTLAGDLRANQTLGAHATKTATQVVAPPAAGAIVAANVSVKWSDGVTATYQNQVTISDDCVVPPPAEPNPAASIDTTCGAATVTATNELGDALDRLTASLVVYVDGTATLFPTVPAGQSYTSDPITFGEDSGDHTVTVRTGPAFGDVELTTATVSSDCTVPVTPIIPLDATATVATTDATCDADGTVSFDQVNATWSDAQRGEDGVFSRIATADDGHLFNAGDGVSDDQTTKTVTYSIQPQLTGDDCAAVVTPPTSTPTTTPVATVNDTPVALETQSAGLADTGSNIDGAIWVAGGGLAAGLLILSLVFWSRRRQINQQ